MRAHGFDTTVEGDGIDVSRRGGPLPETERKLEMLGFLLGFTRLLDQRLEDVESVNSLVRDFLTKYPPE